MQLLRRRRPETRPDYMTSDEHYEEAERLAWVIDVLQSGAKRTLGDVIALARLHLDMAQAAAPAIKEL
jgi:hypothetical protein